MKKLLIITVLLLALLLKLNAMTLEGYLSIRSLPHDAPRFIEAIKSANVPASSYSQAYIILLMMGYPHFRGISENGKLSYFLFSDHPSNQVHHIILAKIEKTASLRTALSLMKWTLKDDGPWTIITKKAEVLDKIKNLDEIKQLASKPLSASFEFHLIDDLQINNFELKKISTLIGPFSAYINLEDKALAVNLSTKFPPKSGIRHELDNYLGRNHYHLEGLNLGNKNGLIRIYCESWPEIARKIHSGERKKDIQ